MRFVKGILRFFLGGAVYMFLLMRLLERLLWANILYMDYQELYFAVGMLLYVVVALAAAVRRELKYRRRRAGWSEVGNAAKLPNTNTERWYETRMHELRETPSYERGKRLYREAQREGGWREERIERAYKRADEGAVKRAVKRVDKKADRRAVRWTDRKTAKVRCEGKRKRMLRIAPAVCLLCFLAMGFPTLARAVRDRGIPESLLKLRERNPETAGFVNAYPSRGKQVQDKDISKELSYGEIPLFLQWDARWGYEQYGDQFFALTGCGPTALSMVVCGLTGSAEWNPYAVSQYSLEHGWYVEGAGTSWDLMTEGARGLGLTVDQGSPDAEYIRNHLSRNTPMIASMLPGDFTQEGHFIVLSGMDQNGQIIVRDPNSKKRSEKSWDVDRIADQMGAVWCYRAG